MATSLAAQLSKIAASSESSLNLKAHKAKHSKSIIFEPRVAASQSFETLYTICHEGFQELCLLDGRFVEYQKNIFSEQSQSEDRSQMTTAENGELNKRLESFMGLIGGKLRLTPAIKAVEWLVRRFRVHEHNTSFIIMTFLPYHTLPMFTTLLSILPTNIPQEYRFLVPYIRSLMQPPRHVIVQNAIHNALFTSTFNSYVLHISELRQQYPALLAFWAGIMTEAIGGMMDKARSGRKSVQQDNEQDLILRLLPTLNKGLSMKKVPDLRLGCYMMLSVMASKGALDDKLLTAMMEAVVLGWTVETAVPGLICLSVLAQHRTAKQLSKRVTKELLKLPNLSNLLAQIEKHNRIDQLASSLCLALVDRLRNDADIRGLAIIQQIIEAHTLKDAQINDIVKALVIAADQIDDSTEAKRAAKPHVASSLVWLAQVPNDVASVVSGAFKNSEVDMDQLELKLHTTIRQATTIAGGDEDTDMIEPDEQQTNPNFKSILQQLPARTVNESSFLCHDTSHIYHDLCHAFIIAADNEANLLSFDGAPILRRDQVLEDTLYLTFYMRTWCGPYPVIARSSALHITTRCLSSVVKEPLDFQALLPYAIAGLADSSMRVRRAAAELLLAFHKLYPSSQDSKKKLKNVRQWNSAGLYGSSKAAELPVESAVRFLNDAIIPALEECVLDKTHVESIFRASLNSSKGSESANKKDALKLSKTIRAAILSFFASHIVHTPLHTVKLRLLACLNQVRGVGDLTRTEVLLPALEHWASLSDTRVQEICQTEQIDSSDYDEQILQIITNYDSDGLQFLKKILCGDVAADRPDFLAAAYVRLQTLWPGLKSEPRLKMAQVLLDVAQGSDENADAIHEAASKASSHFLRTTRLTTDTLAQFLDQLPTAAMLADKPPATKRRRTSHGEIARTPVQNPKQLAAAIRRVTFVLQLVESSEPAEHPELLKGLFTALAELQHFKAQLSSELAYLQNLVLGSLLAIMSKHRTNPDIKLDRSSVRADLLVDCVHKTASPQVQNASLLLIASLAHTAPELVLHSVMPIFTFMGSSVLRQNDEYSAHVISQTIREVIPPLISSLRKNKGNPVSGAAELLLSFVAAYEHIPTHRRKGLFTSLVQTLGPEDFMFALLAMLVDKYGPTDKIKAFAADLSASFTVEVQLQSALKYLELISDILKPKPNLSAILLGANDDGGSNPYKMALDELSLLPQLLSQKRLISQTAKLLDRDDMDAARIRDLYSQLLENILALADTTKSHDVVLRACGDVLESLLGLLSTSEFVKSVEILLDRPNDSLHRKILRSLELRIDKESASDVSSRIAMLSFLPQLTAIIRESPDILYKHTAIACVDKISEKYGKKDLEAVAAAAETIASDHCLGQPDTRLRVMALLCLASLVEILREGVVSILPTAIPKALSYMEISVKKDSEWEKLHNAGYAFISALVHHLPYMVSGGYLGKLLEISNSSAESDLGDESNESRIQCLQLAAKRVDAKSMFGALEKDWDFAVKAGPEALHEYLDVLSTSIENHDKSIVNKYSPILANIFQNAFDLRRLWSLSNNDRVAPDTVLSIESAINDVAMKMIYKFNDATFRPIFSSLISWASSLPKKDKAGKALRLQSIYGFLATFFDNLKSIVATYATYLIEDAVEVLQNVDPADDMSKELWVRVLKTLAICFQHDQVDFWQSPSHFSAIAPVLTAQFLHGSALPLSVSLVPAIVELAATADASENHKELNTTILKHLRSPNASVRLAAVRCQQELTDRLGEEWLQMLPEMLPFISELQEDDNDVVEKETMRWIVKIEGVLGESLDSMLQ